MPAVRWRSLVAGNAGIREEPRSRVGKPPSGAASGGLDWSPLHGRLRSNDEVRRPRPRRCSRRHAAGCGAALRRPRSPRRDDERSGGGRGRGARHGVQPLRLEARAGGRDHGAGAGRLRAAPRRRARRPQEPDPRARALAVRGDGSRHRGERALLPGDLPGDRQGLAGPRRGRRGPGDARRRARAPAAAPHPRPGARRADAPAAAGEPGVGLRQPGLRHDHALALRGPRRAAPRAHDARGGAPARRARRGSGAGPGLRAGPARASRSPRRSHGARPGARAARRRSP